MPRKALTAPEAVGPQLIGHTLPEDAIPRAQMLAVQTKAVAEFGDGLPWDVVHYENLIRHEYNRGCSAFVKAGKLLIVARECATHGEWAGILERTGIPERTAQRMMAVGRRLNTTTLSETLLRTTQESSKLLELLTLSDSELTELDEAEDGLSLSDLGRMSVREMRAAIREYRDTIAAKDERAGQRERQIETLQTDLRKAKRQYEQATPDQQAVMLRDSASVAAMSARVAVVSTGGSMKTALAELLASEGDHRTFACGLIAEVEADLARLRAELELDPILTALPAWMEETADPTDGEAA